MSDTITAPWSSEQVAALEQFQTASGMHPFTCGADQHSLPLRLVPSRSGWHCPNPACGYRQDWAHAFMAEPAAWPKPFGERHGPTPEEVREAVSAVQGQELVQLNACLDRVRAIADRLAAHSRLGVDLEADSIRRGIAQQLHDALGATPPEETL
ncbi:hypothetical protein [Streptomyces sp. SR-10]|uniref:hypothetical protein n=1 Tax=Streptomyces sp. SR-10 TaxID=3416442 RepID=UPI003CEB0F18